MHLRKPLFQSGAQIEKILKGQVGMEAANDVKLGDSFGISRSGGFESFIERHGVGARRILLAAEGAQTAGGNADVRGIDVAGGVEKNCFCVARVPGRSWHPTR